MFEILNSVPKSMAFPSIDSKTLFSLGDTKTNQEVIDKGPNKIPLSFVGTVKTGTDATGGYLLFDGGLGLTISSSILTRTNVEVIIWLGSIQQVGTAYAAPVLDARPPNSNGNYHIVTVASNNSSPAPWKPGLAYPSYDENFTYGPNLVEGGNVVNRLSLKITPTASTLTVNDTLAVTKPVPSSLDGRAILMGISAYDGIVPRLRGRVYLIQIQSLT